MLLKRMLGVKTCSTHHIAQSKGTLSLWIGIMETFKQRPCSVLSITHSDLERSALMSYVASAAEADLGLVSKALGQPQSSWHHLCSQLTSSSILQPFILALLHLGLAISVHQNNQDSSNKWLSTGFISVKTHLLPWWFSKLCSSGFVKLSLSFQISSNVLTGHHGEEVKWIGGGDGISISLF